MNSGSCDGQRNKRMPHVVFVLLTAIDDVEFQFSYAGSACRLLIWALLGCIAWVCLVTGACWWVALGWDNFEYELPSPTLPSWAHWSKEVLWAAGRHFISINTILWR